MRACSMMVCVVCVVVLAVLMQGAVSLPPDFFRNGRGMPMGIPPHKKSIAELDLIASACDYCTSFNPSRGFECRRGNSESRKICVLEFLGELQNVVSEKGWKA